MLREEETFLKTLRILNSYIAELELGATGTAELQLGYIVNPGRSGDPEFAVLGSWLRLADPG